MRQYSRVGDTDACEVSGHLSQMCDQFHDDGFLLIRNVISAERVSELRSAANDVLANERYRATHNVTTHLTAARMFETSRVFEDLIDVEPVMTLVERLLGPDCHMIAQNVMRNAPYEVPFSDEFHVDEPLLFPLPADVDRHDERITMPVFSVVVHMPLTDVTSLENGPTQYVPGSHYSGRKPNDARCPRWEDRDPVAVFARAGDAYLHNGQCWHRAAPNTSSETRLLLQNTYGCRWVSQRFYPYVNYQLPSAIVERSDARRRRILGLHDKGAFS